MGKHKRLWLAGTVMGLIFFGALQPALSARAPDIHFVATPQEGEAPLTGNHEWTAVRNR